MLTPQPLTLRCTQTLGRRLTLETIKGLDIPHRLFSNRAVRVLTPTQICGVNGGLNLSSRIGYCFL